MGRESNKGFLLLMLLMLQFTVYAESISYVEEFDISQFYTNNIVVGSENYTDVLWNGMDNTDVIGEYKMPVMYLRFAVPTYSKNYNVKITDKTLAKCVVLPYDLSVVREPQICGHQDIESGISSLQQTVDDIYLPVYAHVVSDGFVSGSIHIVTVEVCPVTYSPSLREMCLYERMSLELTYDSCDLSEMRIQPLIAKKKNLLTSMMDDIEVCNVSDFRRYSSNVGEVADSVNTLYLIITSEDMKDAFADLEIWKRQKGYDVMLKTVEEIRMLYPHGENLDSNGEIVTEYPSATGVNSVEDAAGSIRQYLKYIYTEYGSSYVLLGGYSDKVPTRYAYYNFVGRFPCDWYYSELNSDWSCGVDDIVGNFFRGSSKAQNLSMEAEHIVSRLLCNNKADVDNYTEKLMLYEGNPGLGDNSYLSKGLYLIEEGIGDTSTSMRYDLNHNPTVVREDISGRPYSPYPTGTDAVEFMNERYGFVSLAGHGYPTSITMSSTKKIPSDGALPLGIKIFNDKDLGFMHDSDFNSFNNGLDLLTNTKYPMIAYAMSCTVAPFDRFLNDGSSYNCDYNMASCFTCAGLYGGPAFIGCSRETFMGNCCEIEKKFGYCISKNSIIGHAMCSMKQMIGTYDSLVCHLIGEPEFRMWTDVPHEHNLSLSSDSSGLSIEKSSVTDLKISVYDGVDSVGNYSIESNTFTLRDYLNHSVSVWSVNYLPQIFFYGGGDLKSEKQLRFILKKAFLGYDANLGTIPFNVCSGTTLSMRIFDAVAMSSGMVISDGGVVEITCDGKIEINGGTIKKGGTLIIKCSDVAINKDFNVEKGATLNILKL